MHLVKMKKSAQVPPSEPHADPRAEAREAVDNLMPWLLGNSSDTEIANQLMLFVHWLESKRREEVHDYLHIPKERER